MTPFLTGPVYPIPIPFFESGAIDKESLHRYAEYLVEGGAGNLLVTVGTSRFNLLTREEMREVNETVAKAAGGRAKVIVSGPGPNAGSTAENIEFAQTAEKIGADAIIVVYPERWYGDDALVEFFHRIADDSPVPVWVHAVPMRDGFGGVHAVKSFEPDMLGRVAEHENIVGVKEENGDRDMFEVILSRFQDKIAVIGAGGAMRRFMKDRPLGATNYLVGTESLIPQLGPKFFEAMMRDDHTTAEELAATQEDPFFETAVKFGWHRSLKESLHILGLMPPHERHPFTRVEEEGQVELREIIGTIGWPKL